MNHVLEAVDLPGEATPAAAVPAWNPVAGLRWENLVRFLLLFALMGAAGHMAWRPSMLRLSVLRSLISPSHGDSLAWRPSEDITPLATPAVKTPSPAEWRLAAGSRESAFSLRPGANRIAMWRGAGMARPQWKRSSANTWNWRNDAPFGVARKPDAEAVPPQKPASGVRTTGSAPAIAGPAGATGTAPVQPLPSRPAAVTVPRLDAPAAVGGGSFAGLPPLAIPSLGDGGTAVPDGERTPSPKDDTIENAADGDEIWGSLRPSAGNDMQTAAATTDVFVTAPPLPSIPAVTARVPEMIPLPSPPATADLPATAEASLPLATVREATEGGERQTFRTIPVVEASHSESRTAGDGAAPAIHTGDISAMAAAGHETPGGSAAVVQPATGDEGQADWHSREITGPLEGAYLTIYPKLKFVGLCLPGQNYIRKYNGVAVPRELIGEKLHAEDGRTPYGKYYVAGHRRDAAGARLLLSWPSPEDALRTGLDAATVEAVENAWLSQALPPQTTGAGGGICLTGLRDRVEWTDGGFALEEPHLEEIFTALADGAWVFIQE